jgi:16S rRNA (adenine1518-N6/adenine1519-N6)-dimethyltransferase
MKDRKIGIIEKDILKWGSSEYFTKNKINNFEYKVIANIPYYITGAIIEKFLEEKIKPSIMILMVQKEVAQRMVSKSGKGSILALCTEYYADVEIIKIVSRGSFTPSPKIDSAVIKINLKKEKLLDLEYLSLEKKYLGLVKIGLAHKRKTLISNLKEYDKKNNKNSNDLEIFNWDGLFEKMNLDKKVRGEDVTFNAWLKLTREVLGL